MFSLDEFFHLDSWTYPDLFCMIEPSCTMLLYIALAWLRSCLCIRFVGPQPPALFFYGPSAVEKHGLVVSCCSQCACCFLWIRLNIRICNFTQTKGTLFFCFCLFLFFNQWCCFIMMTNKMWNETFCVFSSLKMVIEKEKKKNQTTSGSVEQRQSRTDLWMCSKR